MPETAPILLLPGLGADTRMFDPLRAEGLRIQSPPWIDPLPREPLAEYAERFAAAMPEAAPVIGGASFGGMLALEMAQRLRPRTVILLGSCASPDRLRRGERLMERASRTLPTPLLRRIANTGVGIGRLGPMDRDTRAFLVRMLRRASIPFLRWAARAILTWPGIDPDAMEADLLWIHGAGDRIIRPPLDPRAHLVEGAGHIVSITHAQQVARLIRPVITGPDSPTRPPLPDPLQ